MDGKLTLDWGAAQKKLLCLVMIVKDEVEGIVETLESVRDFIDRWCIIDTGSVDGTQDAILHTLEKIPGALHEEKFVDFSTTRNRVLQLADEVQACRWRLMLSGDQVLMGGDKLREAISISEAWAHDVRLTYFNLDYVQVLLSQAGNAGFYVGAVHEIFVHKHGYLPAPAIPGVQVKQCERKMSDRSPTSQRWLRDERLLLKELRDNPSNARTMFYLAQTYQAMLRNQEAIEWYIKCADNSGWDEQTCVALMRAGGLCNDMKMCVDLQIKAYQACPERAEALHYLYNAARNLSIIQAKARPAQSWRLFGMPHIDTAILS